MTKPNSAATDTPELIDNGQAPEFAAFDLRSVERYGPIARLVFVVTKMTA